MNRLRFFIPPPFSLWFGPNPGWTRPLRAEVERAFHPLPGATETERQAVVGGVLRQCDRSRGRFHPVALLATLAAAGSFAFILAFPLWAVWASIDAASVGTISRWIWGPASAGPMRFPTVVMVAFILAWPFAATIVRRERVTAAGRRRLDGRACLGCGHGLDRVEPETADWVRCSECGLVGPRRGRGMRLARLGPLERTAQLVRLGSSSTTGGGQGTGDRSVRRDPAIEAFAEVGLNEAETIRLLDGTERRSWPQTAGLFGALLGLLPLLGIVLGPIVVFVILTVDLRSADLPPALVAFALCVAAAGAFAAAAGLRFVGVGRRVELAAWRRMIRRATARGRCMGCGHSTEGAPRDDRGVGGCSECGRPLPSAGAGGPSAPRPSETSDSPPSSTASGTAASDEAAP